MIGSCYEMKISRSFNIFYNVWHLLPVLNARLSVLL